MLVLPQFRSVAQELDNKSRRIINNKICNLLDDYEKYGRLTNNLSYIIPEYKDKYKELFKKSSTQF